MSNVRKLPNAGLDIRRGFTCTRTASGGWVIAGSCGSDRGHQPRARFGDTEAFLAFLQYELGDQNDAPS